MVAFEAMAEAVLDQPGRAIGALETKTAFPAKGYGCVAPAVEEQQDLLPPLQGLGHDLDERRRQPATALGRALPHVDGLKRREPRRLVAGAEFDVAVAALLGVHQALDRGRGGTQHHRAAAQMAAHHGHVAGLIGDAVLLLVGLVVLLIDDDEPEIGEGQEQGRAGADHKLRLVLRHRAPDPAALRRRQPRMPFGGPGAEALLAAGDELAGQRDLGHEHQRLLAAFETLGDGLEIDLRLARAGDAVEQGYGKAVAGVLQKLVRGLRLLLVERGARPGRIERQGMPLG